MQNAQKFLANLSKESADNAILHKPLKSVQHHDNVNLDLFDSLSENLVKSPHTMYQNNCQNDRILQNNPNYQPLIQKIQDTQVDDLTPRQALELIYSLKELLNA